MTLMRRNSSVKIKRDYYVQQDLPKARPDLFSSNIVTLKHPSTHVTYGQVI